MKSFNSIQKTSYPKRTNFFDMENIYKEQKRIGSIVNYEYLESLNIENIFKHDLSRKYNKDLITLWGLLDMHSFLDFIFGNTINPYILFNKKQILPVKEFSDFNLFEDDMKFHHLLDIKFIEKFKFEGVSFDNVYIAIFEILDNDNQFRPFVVLLTKNELGKFIKFAYGYDSNNNGNVELFLPSFNYPIFLTNKGYFISPLSGKKLKLDVDDYITIDEVEKIYLNDK